jgi:hypothetical protein
MGYSNVRWVLDLVGWKLEPLVLVIENQIRNWGWVGTWFGGLALVIENQIRTESQFWNWNQVLSFCKEPSQN